MRRTTLISTVWGQSFPYRRSFPIEELVRTEDLFYLMLDNPPDPVSMDSVPEEQVWKEEKEFAAKIMQRAATKASNVAIALKGFKSFENKNNSLVASNLAMSLKGFKPPENKNNSLVQSHQNEQKDRHVSKSPQFVVGATGTFGRMKRRWGEVLDVEPPPRAKKTKAAVEEIVGKTSSELQQSSDIDLALQSKTKAVSLQSQPMSKVPKGQWHVMLLSLTGRLMKGVMSGDMSQLLDDLKEAVQRGWKKSSRIIKLWLPHLKRAIVQAPETSYQVLSSDVGELLDLEQMESACAKPTQTILTMRETSKSNFTAMKKSTEHEFSKLMELNKLKKSQTKEMSKKTKEMFNLASNMWNHLEEPILRLIEQVGKSVEKMKKSGGGAKSALAEAASVALDGQVVADLKLLFRLLFTNFPVLTKGVAELTATFSQFVSELDPFMKQIVSARLQFQDAVVSTESHASAALSETHAAVIASLSSCLNEVTQKQLVNFQSFWQKMQGRAWTGLELVQMELQTSASSLAAVTSLAEQQGQNFQSSALTPEIAQPFAGTSALEVEHSAKKKVNKKMSKHSGIAGGLLKAFAPGGALATPAARIGGIFMREIGSMGSSTRGFRIHDTCSWQDPLDCTQLGAASLTVFMIGIAMLFASLGFLCGCVKA
eukprot:TRINITY_DN4496_c0_g2_i2.p1 TRINITY_DN4496_c0_g2~~TRINITY_DN4496_c0_g2_i2.p1  ORF type:complete len:655 (-),score=139.46 TRINITY_DN4496_c0_g2_i2:626-2590(-)